MPQEFQIITKPVGARCNLECTYCYYVERDTPGPLVRAEAMSDEFLEKYVRQHLEAATGQKVQFLWHGGEPTLAGIDFYRKAVEIQKKHAKPGMEITNGIQTNGTLINNEWCEFFKKESFKVAVSLDGPPRLHDYFRVSDYRIPTHSKTIRGFRLLKEWGIVPEILCVVNAMNVEHPLEVYIYFREIGARTLTFYPLVERKPGPLGPVSYQSVPARDFGRFLCAVFDEWKGKDIGKIEVRVFEEAARTAMNQEHTQCIFKKRCGDVPVVEKNGNFYSCDYFVHQEHLVGNIRDRHLGELLEHPDQKAFGESKEATLPGYCRECDVLDMCNGECPKNRLISTPDGEPGLNYLCAGYKMFFRYCKPFMVAMAEQQKQHSQQ
jgi:uncharacterized protein